MLDGGFDVDLEAINENVAEADVVTFFFPLLRRTLLVDTRPGVDGAPLVQVVPMVRSLEERFRMLGRLRPELAKPDSISAIGWTRRVPSLRTDGVWDGVRARLQFIGGADAAIEAERCLNELCDAERLEVRHAVSGVDYRTIWGRAGAGDEG